MDIKKTLVKSFSKKPDIQKLVFALLVFWIPIIIFCKIAGEIIEKEPLFFDKPILYWIHSFSTPFLDQLFISISTAAGPLSLLVAGLLLLGFLIAKRQKLNTLFVLFGFGGAAAGNFVLKLLFQRERPELWPRLVTEHDFSFPSGHSMASAAIITCIIVMLWNTRWRIPSLILGVLAIFAVGVSRLYLGVHYPTDVIAGWCIGLAWVIVVMFVLRKFSRRSQKAIED